MAASQHAASLWDGIAARYDGLRPDQGLTDPATRAAWTALIEPLLPNSNCVVLDVGCGTGSLSLLLADSGHAVTGIDFSPRMIDVAREKAAAAGADTRFEVQDAVEPQFAPASFDAIVSRQVLWALPDRKAALRNWATLLRQNGRLLLVEGRFSSGNGMSEDEIIEALPATLSQPDVSDLSGQAGLWDGPLSDQRLLVVATRR